MRDLMIPPGNHSAAAWVAGSMAQAEALEFETHLVTCADCRAEVAALRARQAQRLSTAASRRRAVQIVGAALATLAAGFALGWWLWQLSHAGGP
jgi:anti-sigma factor RsiW